MGEGQARRGLVRRRGRRAGRLEPGARQLASRVRPQRDSLAALPQCRGRGAATVGPWLVVVLLACGAVELSA